MSQEITIYEGHTLAIERAPDVVLAEAQRAAQALQGVIGQKPDKVMMNGQQYLEFEDWQTLARFYGLTAKEDGDPEYVELGETRGFKASAVALNRNGDTISRATAYCLSDEDKWGARAKYEWGYITKSGDWQIADPGRDQIIWEKGTDGKNRPKKERRQTGVEAVPLFQLASMAQTRACAKVLRNVLSWVAVLAGYRPTPAEELTNSMMQQSAVPNEEHTEQPVEAVGAAIPMGAASAGSRPTPPQRVRLPDTAAEAPRQPPERAEAGPRVLGRISIGQLQEGAQPVTQGQSRQLGALLVALDKEGEYTVTNFAEAAELCVAWEAELREEKGREKGS
jgi:hypothetical protein